MRLSFGGVARGQLTPGSTYCVDTYCRYTDRSTDPTIRVVAELRQAFGKRVRDLRAARGWSQEQLAERAGLHRNYVGMVERGERNPALLNIARLARVLNVSLAELFAAFTK